MIPLPLLFCPSSRHVLKHSTSTTRYQLGEITQDSAADMQKLFATIFNKPMSPAFWDWKYRQSGGHGMGVWDDDTLVAHYGGCGVEVSFAGNTVRTVQICDVMVDPSVRQGVRQHSPYFLAATTFIEQFVGHGKEFLFGFGFPSDRHLKLAEHLGIYARVGQMSEVIPKPGKPAISDRFYRWQTFSCKNMTAHAGVIDKLWQQMQQSLPQALIVIKDSRRLHYRYQQHPDTHYDYWLLTNRLTGTVVAMMVMKEEAGRVLVMDIIGHCAQVARVLRMAARTVYLSTQKSLVFWLSTNAVEVLGLSDVDIVQLPISTPANIWTDSPLPAALHNRWWLTAGDTDYL